MPVLLATYLQRLEQTPTLNADEEPALKADGPQPEPGPEASVDE